MSKGMCGVHLCHARTPHPGHSIVPTLFCGQHQQGTVSADTEERKEGEKKTTNDISDLGADIEELDAHAAALGELAAAGRDEAHHLGVELVPVAHVLWRARVKPEEKDSEEEKGRGSRDKPRRRQ